MIKKKIKTDEIVDNKDKAEINDELDRVIKLTGFVLVASPIIIYLFVIFIDTIVRAYGGFRFVQGSRDAWIGFAGSLIGGSMTMLAFMFTLRHEEKRRIADKLASDNLYKEEKASTYLPIFQVVEGRMSSNEFIFTLKSVTDKPIRDFGLSFQSFGNDSLMSNVFGLEDIPIISINDKFSFNTKIDYSSISRSHKHVILSKIHFSYSDALRIKRYTHGIEFLLEVEYVKASNRYAFRIVDTIKNFPIIESHNFVEDEYLDPLNVK